MKKRAFSLITFILLISLTLVSAGFNEFTGITDVKKVTPSHTNYNSISQQYSMASSELYEVTYHIKEGWNFLPYSILGGRDAVTGEASCWKQDDQRGNIGATKLEYVYIYEPDESILPENRLNYYVGGASEEWSSQPLYSYRHDLWTLAEPNSKLTLPVNWVYSPINCDFVFYSGWLDTENYAETEKAIRENLVNLELEEGWQVVLQLFPGFTWNEIKGDCIIEEINFWDPTSQSYTIGPNEKQENLDAFMNTMVEKQDYFKPIMMKVKNSCTLGTSGPSTPSCEKVLDNGDSAENVNLVFIPAEYSDLNLWQSDVDDYMNTFFSIDPMQSSMNKFNIWRIDGTYSTFVEDPSRSQLEDDKISLANQIARSCTNDVDMIFIIEDNSDSPADNYGFAMSSDSLVAQTRLKGPVGEAFFSDKTLVHEFGHAFVKLGDEYPSSAYLFRYSESPNIDTEGCPKWCSGQLNQNADCYDTYIVFRDCLYNITNGYVDENAYQEDLRSENPQCGYPEILCDLGTNCRTNTGCYWNAKSLISFKSSAYSLMAYPEQDPFEFNLISQEAIQNKIDLLTS